jgi:hypothetical protein
MSDGEGSQRERGARRAGGRALAPGRLSEERTQSDREGSQRERGARRAERDRTLSRVRTTTAVTGIGAVLAGGALTGWLGHAADSGNASSSTSDSSSSSSSSDGSGSSSSSDGGLTGPTTSPESGSGSSGTQPGVTSGGS